MADKTYVPGVDENYTSSAPEGSDASEKRSQNFPGNETFIPSEDGDPKCRGGNRSIGTLKDKPVLGFLYSISRTAFGEFWPVYLGSNIIGRNDDADVVLSEGTVSAEHATLIVHQEDDGDVYAGIKDNGSTHGVKVNGKSAHFDVVGCNSMDIITIGKSYELLFILLDAKSLGLKKADNFVEVKQAATRRVDRRIITNGPSGTSSSRSGATNPLFGSRLANPSSSERTRALDGSPEPFGGGTKTR